MKNHKGEKSKLRIVAKGGAEKDTKKSFLDPKGAKENK